MALLVSAALVSGTVVVGIFRIRKDSRNLVELLRDSQERQVESLHSTEQSKFGIAKKLVSDLFNDNRQQYQRTLGAVDEAVEQVIAEQSAKRDLLISMSGLVLATSGGLFSPILYLPGIACVVYVARQLFQDSYRVLFKERRFDFHVILALSVVMALIGGFIWAAAFGATWAMFNYFLISKTERRAKQAVTDLFGGQVHCVWVLIDGKEIEIAAEQVQIDDVVVVNAGEIIPVDGVITLGTATIDQHMLTGEAQPAEKSINDPVFASTLMISGRIYVRVTKAGEMTVAAQIRGMLVQTDEYRQLLQSRSDRLANQLVLPVLALGIAILPFAGLNGATGILWSFPGLRMKTFGPLSMLSYLQMAAQRSILIKDGRSLESLQEIDTVIFDKTGTLTLEQPSVYRIFCIGILTEDEVLRYAAAAEVKQSHPIARAILQAAQDRNLDLPKIDDAHIKMGFGLKVSINGHVILVGSIRFMETEDIDIPPLIATQQANSHALGNSFVLVAIDSVVAGAIELQPTVRNEAREIVSSLQARGIETVIISGDHNGPTRRLAELLGIDRYYAEVLPEDKSNLVTQMQDAGKKVCFVGDGINDSLALQTAYVSVSLRGATAVATDVAQIIFMDGTLRQLPQLFELAEEFQENMKVNYFAAIAPGALCIAGTFLLGWGVTTCVVIMQASTPVGIYNGVKPLLTKRTGLPVTRPFNGSSHSIQDSMINPPDKFRAAQAI